MSLRRATEEAFPEVPSDTSAYSTPSISTGDVTPQTVSFSLRSVFAAHAREVHEERRREVIDTVRANIASAKFELPTLSSHHVPTPAAQPPRSTLHTDSTQTFASPNSISFAGSLAHLAPKKQPPTTMPVPTRLASPLSVQKEERPVVQKEEQSANVDAVKREAMNMASMCAELSAQIKQLETKIISERKKTEALKVTLSQEQKRAQLSCAECAALVVETKDLKVKLAELDASQCSECELSKAETESIRYKMEAAWAQHCSECELLKATANNLQSRLDSKEATHCADCKIKDGDLARFQDENGRNVLALGTKDTLIRDLQHAVAKRDDALEKSTLQQNKMRSEFENRLAETKDLHVGNDMRQQVLQKENASPCMRHISVVGASTRAARPSRRFGTPKISNGTFDGRVAAMSATPASHQLQAFVKSVHEDVFGGICNIVKKSQPALVERILATKNSASS